MDASNSIIVDMVQMWVVHAVATGVMQDAQHEWKHIQKPNQSWNHWKEHFNSAFNKLKEFHAITVKSIGYKSSNITEKMVATDVMMALDNLVSTAMLKMDAIYTLVVANNQLAHTLAQITKENEKFIVGLITL